MANVSSSNGLEKRPKLRFPGFDEPYKQCRIGDIYAEFKPFFDELGLDFPFDVEGK